MKVRALNLYSLKIEFENMKIEKNKVVNEFSNRIIKVVNQMKSYDKEISDIGVVGKVLISLSDKLNHIMVVVE